MLKAAIKHAMSIVGMRLFIVEDLSAEVPRLVLLLGIDSIGALGVIAWGAFRWRYRLKHCGRRLHKCN